MFWLKRENKLSRLTSPVTDRIKSDGEIRSLAAYSPPLKCSFGVNKVSVSIIETFMKAFFFCRFTDADPVSDAAKILS